MSIKRYDMRGNTWPADDGNVVSYLDHSAVVAELEARCADLAAENAALKDYSPQPGGAAMMEALDAFEAQDDYPEGGMMDAFEILCCKRVKTPATDAFLAEVRARGADSVAAYHAEREEALIEIAPFASRDHKNARIHAMGIAAQLRQEAK